MSNVSGFPKSEYQKVNHNHLDQFVKRARDDNVLMLPTPVNAVNFRCMRHDVGDRKRTFLFWLCGLARNKRANE